MSNKIKILQITDQSFVDHSVDQYLGLSEYCDYHVYIIYQSLGVSISNFLKQPNVIGLKQKYRFRNIIRNSLFYKRIYNRIKKEKCDLVWFNGTNLYTFFLAYFLQKNGFKIITSIHDVNIHPGRTKSHELFSAKLTIKYIKNHLVHSINQLNLINRGNNYMVSLPIIKTYGTNSELPIKFHNKILFFGNIFEYKGLDTLIKAEENITCKNPDLKIMIYGKCSDFSVYEKLMKDKTKYQLNIGWVKDEDITLAFKKTDLLVLPYKNATQSGPLMVAYSFGIPVVCSNIEGLNEFVVDNKSGKLFSPNNPEDLAIKINEIYGNFNKYRDMCNYVQKETQLKYSDKSIAIQLMNTFHKVLNLQTSQIN